MEGIERSYVKMCYYDIYVISSYYENKFVFFLFFLET